MSNNSENFLSIDNKTKLTDSTRLILKYWYTKCKVYYKCHKQSSYYYDKLNKYMGLPAIFMGIFNTTTIFSNYNSQIQPLSIVNGVLSFIATLLVAMQNHFDLGKLAITHSKLANGYNKITNTIEKILMYEKLSGITEISSKTIDNMMNQMEYLQQDSPIIPDKIWNINKVELKGILSLILNKETIVTEITTANTPTNTTKSNNSEIDTPENTKNDHAIEIVYSNNEKK